MENKHIELVKKWLADNDSVSKEQLAINYDAATDAWVAWVAQADADAKNVAKSLRYRANILTEQRRLIVEEAAWAAADAVYHAALYADKAAQAAAWTAEARVPPEEFFKNTTLVMESFKPPRTAAAHGAAQAAAFVKRYEESTNGK